MPIRSGEIDFSVVSPFEIYPDSSVCERIEDCQSIIHAKAYTAQQVRNMYNINVKGQSVNTYSLDGVSVGVGGLGFNGTASKIVESVKEDSVIVIERYEKESEAYPFGRLTIVAGDQLVYDGKEIFRLLNKLQS